MLNALTPFYQGLKSLNLGIRISKRHQLSQTNLNGNDDIIIIRWYDFEKISITWTKREPINKKEHEFGITWCLTKRSESLDCLSQLLSLCLSESDKEKINGKRSKIQVTFTKNIKNTWHTLHMSTKQWALYIWAQSNLEIN